MMKYLGVLAVLALTACSAPRTTVRTDGQAGTVVFKVKPSAATVLVDGKAVGTAREFDGSARVLKLEPGTHVIRLSAPGRGDYETKIYLSDSQELIQVELPEAP